MVRYIIRRFLLALTAFFFISLLLFLITYISFDPVKFGNRLMPQEVFEEFIDNEYGLNEHVVVAYFKWIGGIFTGNWGASLLTGTDASVLIGKTLPNTLYIGFIVFVISIVFGGLMGTWTALKHPKISGYLVYYLLNIVRAVPVILLPILLLLLFVVHFKWLYQPYIPLSENFWLSVKYLVLPVLSICIVMIPVIALQVRTAMLEYLQQAYVSSTDTDGPEKSGIAMKSAFKLSLVFLLNSAGIFGGILLTNLVIIENMFNFPGIGRLIIEATYARDIWVVQNTLLVYGMIIISFILVVNILHAWFNIKQRKDQETTSYWRPGYV